MAKKEAQAQETPVAAGAVEAKPPESLAALQAEVAANDEAIRRSQEALLARQKAQAEARAKFEAERAVALAKKEKEEAGKRLIPVIVQRRRNAPVKFNYGSKVMVLESMRPTKVSKRELRILQGLRNRGVIDLVIGPLQKDGEVGEKKPPAAKG